MKLLPLLLLSLAACATPGYRGLWTPKPLELVVTGEQGQRTGTLLATVLGQWRGGDRDGEVHVRIGLENTGVETLELPAGRVELRAGDLQPLVFSEVLGGGPGLRLEPGGAGLLDLAFVPPVEGADLRGLHLRWVLLQGAREMPGSASFQRAPAAAWYGPPYGYPYAYPYPAWPYGWRVGGGWSYGGAWVWR